MGKLKTRRTLAKRLKVSANGKLLREKITASHLKVKLTSGRRFRKQQEATINATFSKNLRQMLPKVKA